MSLNKIYAQLNCTDMTPSASWFEKLFGREPDATPMNGLKEWHHSDNAGFQLVENQHDAGHGCLTLIVGGLDKERQRLLDAGFNATEISSGDIASIFQVSDPDGNMIILAEPNL